MKQHEHIARSINKLSNQIRRNIEAMSQKNDFSGAQGRILHYILAQQNPDEHSIFQKDIEEEFGMRPSSASELLKKLEEKQLITRQPLSTDGRLKEILPSKKALQSKQIVVEDLERFEQQLRQGISDEEIAFFMRIMEKMHCNISK